MSVRGADLEGRLLGLRSGLLRGRPAPLRPDQGDEAFDGHKILASAVHRASRLDKRASESDTDAWVRYFEKHFPEGRNDPADARLLFGDWRSSLLKDDTPGVGVAITHGQSVLHWRRDGRGRLCLNLEDAWDDFGASVDSFVDYVRMSVDRRKIILRRWRAQDWVVEPFHATLDLGTVGTAINVPHLSASMATTATLAITTESGVGAPVTKIQGARSATGHGPDE